MAIAKGDYFKDKQSRYQMVLEVDRPRDQVLVEYESSGKSEWRCLSALENILDKMLMGAAFPGIAAEREAEAARRRDRAATNAAESRPDWVHGPDYLAVVRLLAAKSTRFTALVPPHRRVMFEDDYFDRTGGERVDWTNKAVHLLPPKAGDGKPLNKKHYSTVISFTATSEEATFVASLSPQIAERLQEGASPGTYSISCNALSRELLGLGFRFSLGPQNQERIRTEG